jgi:hypothetical protein
MLSTKNVKLTRKLCEKVAVDELGALIISALGWTIFVKKSVSTEHYQHYSDAPCSMSAL